MSHQDYSIGADAPMASSWQQLKIEVTSPGLIDTQTKTQTVDGLPPFQDVESQFFERRNGAGRQLAMGYTTTCDPSRITVLKVNGQELRIADWVSFGVGAIEWKPGEGWPLYRVADPKHDYNINMRWNAYVHAIIVGCQHNDGSITFTAPYAAAGAYHLGPGRVVAFVNDDKYDDNRGFFNVEVYGWT